MFSFALLSTPGRRKFNHPMLYRSSQIGEKSEKRKRDEKSRYNITNI